jgi:hypothetical protein
MRNRGMILGATLALGLMALAGCDNTQGTSANPDMLHETINYTDNGNPQNTGSGSGMMIKPSPTTGKLTGGDTPSQAVVKGTDDATGAFPASLTGPGSGVTITPQHTIRGTSNPGMPPAGAPHTETAPAGATSSGTNTPAVPGGTATPPAPTGPAPGTAP